MRLHRRAFCYVPIITSGGATGLNAEGIAGRVLVILTEVIFLMVWLSLVAGCAYLCCQYDGKHLPLHFTIIYPNASYFSSVV